MDHLRHHALARCLLQGLPISLCLLYALLLRHPAARSHWQEALQLPRLAALALALYVALRHRPRDPARLVGLVMAGSAGVLVVTGAWGVGGETWWKAQAISAASWCVVAGVVWRARG